MDLIQFVAVFCTGSGEPYHIPHVPVAEGERPAGVIYRGSVRNLAPFGEGFTVSKNLPDGFTEIGEFAFLPYRLAWKNDQLRAIVTYCEGDVDVTIDRTPEGYAARLRAAHAFYAT